MTHVTKKFGDFVALQDLNLHIRKGSIYGLVGINGAGKTTIIKHLAGVYRQDQGDISIDGAPVYDCIKTKEKVGFIPDELFFFPQYTIGNLTTFYARLYAQWNPARFQTLLRLFQLDEKRKLSKLSKGMQKQAAFAFVLSTMPKVLLLDEPIDGLDPLVRRLVMQQVREDVAEREMTVLVSSHNLREMEGLCDAIGIIEQGHMRIERQVDDLKSDIHKVQIALPLDNAALENPFGNLTLLHQEKRGSVSLLVVKGNQQEISHHLQSLHPLVLDFLPLTLEEIFIYEAEGQKDEIPC